MPRVIATQDDLLLVQTHTTEVGPMGYIYDTLDNVVTYDKVSINSALARGGWEPVTAGTKSIRHVRDSAYWGMPVGTPIEPGMKPTAIARSVANPLAEIRQRISGYEGAGTPDDPIKVHGDIDAAKVLLSEGKSIRMDSVMEVGTLVTELAHVADDARSHGEKAPNYDLCKVSVPGTNLFCQSNIGIPRIKMPQLKGRTKDGTTINVQEDWKQSLREEGISITRKVVPASNLKASQSELVGPAVALMIEDMLSGAFSQEAADAPIFVTKDGYVLDGHHRWAAKVGIDTMDGKLGDVPMTVDMIDIEIGEAIDRARAYAAKRGVVPKKEVHIKPLKKSHPVIIEEKLRRVRDAEYWGAPVGTPLPLPKVRPSEIFDNYRVSLSQIDSIAEQDRSERERIIQRHWDDMDDDARDRTTAMVETVRMHGHVFIAQPQDIALKVMEDGRFKSQFETETSNGALAFEMRAAMEKSMFGLDPTIPATERPIYGYVGVTNVAPLAVTQYGAIRFHLKPSARARTMFTMDDSLDSVSIPVPMEGRLTPREMFPAAPMHMMVGGMPLTDEGTHLSAELDRDDPIQAVGTFERIQYIEAQVMGGVSMDDVDGIWLPDLKNAFAEIDAQPPGEAQEFLLKKLERATYYQREIMKLAQERDIPLYTYDGVWMAD